MKRPRVSICIPVYNNGLFLAETLESVLCQSFGDFELLIRDDCSTDNSRDIVSRYQQADKRIIFTANGANLGMVNNWNACLQAARGDYVRFLFGDDLLSSAHAIGKMVSLLDADPEVSLVASARELIDERSLRIKTAASFPDNLVASGTDIINRCLFAQKNLIGEPSVVMFRRSQAGRGFDNSYRQYVDLEMWFHLLEQGRFCFIGEPLASFRLHAGQQTVKNVRDLLHIDEMFALMDSYFAKPYATTGPVGREFLQYHQHYRIWKAFKNGMISREEALAKIARRCPPWRFFALAPLYRLLSPLWKLQQRLLNSKA